MTFKFRVCCLLSFLLAFITDPAICQNKQAAKPNTKGVYYTWYRNPEFYHFPVTLEGLYFYEDGTFCSLSESVAEMKDTGKISNALHDLSDYQSNSFWGFYSVHNDTVLATSYTHDSQRMGKIPQHWQMMIRDDEHVVEVIKIICDRCKGQYSEYGNSSTILFQPARKYRFEPAAAKPDSADMWLRRKQWFDNKLNALKRL